MSRFEGPQGIVTNGLVLNLDAGDPDSYTRSQPPYVEVLVVAGGGSGGTSAPSNGGGGGGGAGGVIYNSAYQLSSAAAITVTVGAGGAGQTTGESQGNNGSNSVFGSLTAVGGGGGGGAGVNTTGKNGGSGGGAGYAGYYNNFNSGTGTAGQGFRGGYVLANNNGAAGGGAGGVGNNTFDSRPEPGYPGGGGGLGGPGVSYSISGTSTLYSTGGAGSLDTANTIVSGSGTQGAYGGSGPTSTAASGIVIVRYPGLPAATGGTITYLNGYTIHTFTSSGTFTPYLWNDVSGGGRNGTLVNGVGFNSYKNGGYLIFDGTDDYVSNINNSGMLSNGTGGFSYFAWVNLQGKPQFGTIFENGLYTSGILIRYNYDGVEIYSQGSYFGKFSFNPSLSTWNYLGFVRNGNFIDFYVNGVYQTALGFTASISYSSNLFIGTSQHATDQVFNGYIPVAQIYNRTLSTTEITQNFNAQKNRFGL
jgi:hypothetical protein